MAHALDPGSAHVWVTTVASNVDDTDILAATLSPDEEERATRGPERVRGERLVSRALLRCALSRYADVAPTAWELDVNAHGRPDVAAPSDPPLRVNVAHSRGVIACGIILDRDIGVDVEDTTRTVARLDQLERYLSPPERTRLNTEPVDTRLALFFRYWTLKEAYVKACGTGIVYGMDGFTIDLDADPPRVIDGDEGDAWVLHTQTLPPSHRVAIAVRRHGNEPITVHVRTIDRLATWAGLL